MTKFVLKCLAVLAASATVWAQASYVPNRVFVSAKKQFADFETLVAELSRADVVFVGEQHDDRNTHRLELALLEGLARRRGEIVVALEMLERDAQEPLDHFAMGRTDESEFVRDARVWPQYATDYKPLVDFAIDKHWPIVAANVPRGIAADVSKSGLDVLKGKNDAERALFAKELKCSTDDKYYRRFADAMGDHEGAAKSTDAAATMVRYYEAQCLKDETMAESIAQAHTIGSVGGKRPLVVAFNGSFHSDFGQGTAERTRRRLPAKRLVVVSVLPVQNLDDVAPDGDARKRADYLLYTLATKKP